jgi:hypothetical protein
VPKNPALRIALRNFRKQNGLSQPDRSHVDEWLEVAEDQIWATVADKLRGRRRGYVSITDPYAVLISEAVWARNIAEQYSKLDLKQERKQAKKGAEETARDLRALAAKMEDVVNTYLACKAAHQRVAPPPDADPATFEPPLVAARKQSLAWLEKDAKRLRELAAFREGHPFLLFDFLAAPLSRQRAGHKRPESRAIRIFVQEMASFMKETIGTPMWTAVADLTNVAFPSANFEAEDVRLMCRPTKRAERRKKPVHSNVKSGKKSR